MTSNKSNIEISRAKAKQLFDEGYQLAYETKTKNKPWNKIFELWIIAAKVGNKRAQFYVGTCYDLGNGVDKDISEAFKWYMKAAKSGKMEAQYNIGFFYKEGELVKQVHR